MKELHGAASALVSSPITECFELLCAVERYENRRPTKARATLHVAAGPLVRDFNLLLAVSTVQPTLVRLARIPHDASDEEQFDVTWRLEQHSGTRIQLDLEASLSVPRLLPIGGLGDSLADGFARAAASALA